MAERDSLHQQFNLRGGLEAAGQSYDPPLLPYEKSLIQAIGCSEEDYRRLIRYAAQRQRVRPAEYEKIPDIVASGIDPVTVLIINLVVGVLLAGASLLLAPKPPSFDEPKKIKGKKLDDQIGPSSFNQSSSFDNAPSLAKLNAPIPIPFGKRGTGADGEPTGGLILVPALVWSRLYAYGRFQAFEGVYVAGEYGLASPKLPGVLIGTQGLAALGNKDYALYWSSQQGSNRPSPANLLLGTQGAGATGTIGRNIFTAPTDNGQFSNDFSMSYVPSGDTTFGTETPIENGTGFRYNWEIVSAPFSGTLGPDVVEERRETIAKRRKIAGTEADTLHIENGQEGQPGEGREYSRHMGLIQHNSNQYINRTVVSVAQGDTCVFEIDNRNGEWEAYEKDAVNGFEDTEINLEDLINNAKNWRRRASDLMVVGSRWIIGASAWVVVQRGSFNEGQQLFITLQCTALLGVAEIGIPGTRTVREPLAGFEGLTPNPNKRIGAAFYNICGLRIATIRPIRRDTDVIEIGIRSRVFNRANGLCNFNDIPSPRKVFKLDKKDIQIQSGKMNKYFKRSSCFSIWVRPILGRESINANEGATDVEGFVRIPQVFCVQGSSPVDQNNYIRIRPFTKGLYEYRFIPRTGSDIATNSIPTNTVIVLDSNDGVPYTPGGAGSGIGRNFDTPYGTFRLTTQGREVQIGEILANEELFSNPQVVTPPAPPATSERKPAAVVSTGAFAANAANGNLVRHAWWTSVLGLARSRAGQRNVRATFRHFKPGDGNPASANPPRYINVTIIADALRIPAGQNYLIANSGSDIGWTNVRYETSPTDPLSTGGWGTSSDGFTVARSMSGNPFAERAAQLGPRYTQVSQTFQVTRTQLITNQPPAPPPGISGDRKFEIYSQVADCSHYLELEKSNASGPEHEITWVNEYITNDSPASYDDMTTIGLSIKSSGEINNIEQLRFFVDTGIPVNRLIEGDLAPSNLFADLVYYLLTNKSQGVGGSVPAELVDEDSLRSTAIFLRANKIFFDGVLEDSESFRNFLYDNAALQICSFTIKNGRFGMIPAVPVEANGNISLNPIPIEQIFTSGNIIEDSLELNYVDASQRSNIRALVTWRVMEKNDLPYKASALLTWADLGVSDANSTEQSFDLSEFCTNREQALKTARFLMSSRRRITKNVSFKTVPDALGVQPGSYIRVITEASTYSSTATGQITDAGSLVTVSSVADGNYDAILYDPATQNVTEANIDIASNAVTDSTYHGFLFTLLSSSTDYSVYQIESLNLEEDGLVSISAVEVPTDAQGVSIIAKDVLTAANFSVLE